MPKDEVRAPRILLVEDDSGVREIVELALDHDGYEVRALADGLRLRQVMDEFRPDLAVLDVRLLEGPDGLQLARGLRQVSDIPILFLTAADAVADRLAGFEVGADDYLTKPFSVHEFAARVKALLRRSGRLTSQAWQVGDLVVDEVARTATYNGTDLALTRTEFDLLCALSQRPNEVISKSRLLGQVWGYEAYNPNLVEVHVGTLRRKIEEHGDRLIHTVRGVGYVLRPSP